MMASSDFVHEYTDKHGRTWWVVAQWRDGRYYAPQRRDVRKLTGCHTTFGSLDYVAGDAYHYRRRHDALRRARIEYPPVDHSADWDGRED